MHYQFFKVRIADHIAKVSFNRPEKANSLHADAWKEMKLLFEEMDKTPAVRVIVLSGEGKHFCAGIDLALLMDIQSFQQIDCEGRKREKLREHIIWLQESVSSIEKCRKPVIAAIHGACIGAAVDIISACDFRYCTADAKFSIREIDMGLVADLGTLQRLPKFLNYGILAEMAYTGRDVNGEEAEKIGLVNRVYPNKETLISEAMAVAKTIASKSPLCIRGTKEILQYSRDHSVAESLNYMVAWNASMLISKDLTEAFQAKMEKREAEFED